MISATFPTVLTEFYAASKSSPARIYGIYGEFEKREIPLILPRLPTVLLPPELIYFHSNYQCDASFGATSVSFTSFAGLERRQEGFAFFSTDYGKTMQPDPNWNKNWTVFADVNDDPIVADAGTAGTPVYAAVEGVNYKMIAPSLEVFFIILTEITKVSVSLLEQRPKGEDTEEEIKFDEQVRTPAILKRLVEITDDQYVKALAHFFYS